MVSEGVIVLMLSIVTGLGLMQVILRKQRRPVPTKKAITVTGTAALLTLIVTIVVSIMGFNVLLPFIILLQPVMIACAWLLWWPVDSVLKARIMQKARALRNSHSDMTVIGVTGSVGKTTTKELIACVLKDLKPDVTPAYVNSEIGVANWLSDKLRITDYGLRESKSEIRNPKLFVVEMGAYQKGEIALMCSFVKPTLGVVTMVGTQHIALFGSQQNLFEAKSELVSALPSDGRAFLNGDNELCRKMASVSSCPVVIAGTGGQCDLEAFDIEETAQGIRFKACDTVFDVPLHGTHNVVNVLLAIAVGEHLGVPLDRMRGHLRSFTPLLQTFSVRTEAGVRILDDTHNSSAASVKAAIAWTRTQPEQQKILLAAGLIEMGEHQSPAEQELGTLARTVFQRIIVIDPQSAKNFASGGATVESLTQTPNRIPPGSLLVCTGRIAESAIQRILPVP